MREGDTDHDDVLHASEATWMDFYVLYSFLIGAVAIVTGTLDKDVLTAVWGMWTSCAIAYFARDRQTWSHRWDAAVIIIAIPVATVPDRRHVIQFVAYLQIAIHAELLVQWKLRLRRDSSASTSPPAFYSEDEEESDVSI